MLTQDVRLSRLFCNQPESVCDRVRGFFYGYNAVLGKGRDYMSSLEYSFGWDEGKSLRFDEMKAAHQAWMAKR
jgi:hypothetical protein